MPGLRLAGAAVTLGERGARREAGLYRRALEEVLEEAIKRELDQRGDDWTHALVERLGKLLRGKRPHGTGGR